ncbi:hypothetical protein Pelo_2745 [Pelomyxa schiedti]|nr:hypothetical protein Pelo_2745 [Pelomyxa schiedti]
MSWISPLTARVTDGRADESSRTWSGSVNVEPLLVVRHRLRVNEQLLALRRHCTDNVCLSDIFAPHDRLTVCLLLRKPSSVIFTFGHTIRAYSDYPTTHCQQQRDDYEPMQGQGVLGSLPISKEVTYKV